MFGSYFRGLTIGQMVPAAVPMAPLVTPTPEVQPQYEPQGSQGVPNLEEQFPDMPTGVQTLTDEAFERFKLHDPVVQTMGLYLPLLDKVVGAAAPYGADPSVKCQEGHAPVFWARDPSLDEQQCWFCGGNVYLDVL